MTEPDPIRDIQKLAYAARTARKVVMVNRKYYTWAIKNYPGWEIRVYG